MNNSIPPIPPASQSIPPPPPGTPGSASFTPLDSTDKTLAILCHVSLFFGVGFLLPLIVYLVKRENSVYLASHAREVLNFHISLFVYCLVTFPFVFILIGIPVYIVIGIAALVCSIIGAMRASDGLLYHYPFTFRLV